MKNTQIGIKIELKGDSMEIKFTEMEIFKDTLELFSKVYNHPKCSQEIKDYIQLELMRIFGKEYDIKGLLRHPK